MADETPNVLFRDAWIITEEAPAVEYNMDVVREIAAKQINKWRDLENDKPIRVFGTLFSTDDSSKSVRNITGTILAGTAAAVGLVSLSGEAVNPNQKLTWTTDANDDIELTIKQVAEIGQALMVRTNLLHEYTRPLKAQVRDPNTTIEDVEIILAALDKPWGNPFA